MRSESDIQAEVLREHRKLPRIRLFRNNVGYFWAGKEIKGKAKAMAVINNPSMKWSLLIFPRRVQCGLKVGSSDLIGWQTITVTEDMVGKDIAVFASAELKDAEGTPSPDQTNWLNAVNKSGGIAGIVRSMKDLYKIFNL